MQVFDFAEALLSDATQSHFATRLRIIPQAGGKVVVSGPDPSRPVLEVSGILDVGTVTMLPQGTGSRDGNMTSLQAGEARVTIARASFGSNEPPRAGDHIQALERPGQPTYRVVAKDPLGTTELVFSLTPVVSR